MNSSHEVETLLHPGPYAPRSFRTAGLAGLCWWYRLVHLLGCSRVTRDDGSDRCKTTRVARGSGAGELTGATRVRNSDIRPEDENLLGARVIRVDHPGRMAGLVARK